MKENQLAPKDCLPLTAAVWIMRKTAPLLSRRAGGFPFSEVCLGRERREKFGEPIAPEQSDRRWSKQTDDRRAAGSAPELPGRSGVWPLVSGERRFCLMTTIVQMLAQQNSPPPWRIYPSSGREHATSLCRISPLVQIRISESKEKGSRAILSSRIRR